MQVSQINNTNFKGFLAINNVNKINKKSSVKISKLVINTSDIYRVSPVETINEENLGVEILTRFKEKFKIDTHDNKNIKKLFNTFITKLSEAEEKGYAEFY